MIQVKGRFITLVGTLMGLYKEALTKADQELFNEYKQHWHELNPEGWYDARHYRNFMSMYAKASPGKDNALITLGKLIYPTIKQTTGFPSHLKTPIDFLEFESQAYTENIKGQGVNPRRFIKKEPGYVIIQTKMLEQDCKALEGVYMGIMKMAGVHRGKIEQVKCLKTGDAYCEFHILWKAGVR